MLCLTFGSQARLCFTKGFFSTDDGCRFIAGLSRRIAVGTLALALATFTTAATAATIATPAQAAATV
jgi:hypothetical protein